MLASILLRRCVADINMNNITQRDIIIAKACEELACIKTVENFIDFLLFLEKQYNLQQLSCDAQKAD